MEREICRSEVGRVGGARAGGRATPLGGLWVRAKELSEFSPRVLERPAASPGAVDADQTMVAMVIVSSRVGVGVGQ